MKTKNKQNPQTILSAIEARVVAELPEAEIRVSEPAFVDGLWLADFVLGDRAVTVQPEAADRVGLTVFPSEWGVEADEYFDTIEAAAARVVEALQDTSAPALGKLLRELRKYGALSQTEVAELLDVQQPAVSKLERRDDVTVRMLLLMAQRVGARVRVSFEVGGRQIVLDPKVFAN